MKMGVEGAGEIERSFDPIDRAAILIRIKQNRPHPLPRAFVGAWMKKLGLSAPERYT
ncbi:MULTISPECIES: hypothetical protein [unclassified Sphingomonas]|uniref:hypothetical protein n=2 Tax=Sphingomonas TaxID=13687 RepID=UPI0013DDFF70|nr:MULTISPECIES: hypothetical protein [unclassified Sphingomonas]